MRYWVWLHECLGCYSKRIRQIMEDFSTPEQLFHADRVAIVNSGLFSPKEVEAIEERSLAAADSIIGQCRRMGIRILTYGEEAYPAGLRAITDPPAVLFCQGNMELLKGRGVAIVGTRNPTLTGKRIAFRLAFQLSINGYTIVSGAADGIDAQAHKGALQGVGSTIGVLGGGLNHHYLAKNQPIRDEIARNGLLLSEYPPDREPVNYTFPRRNRIIAALSECTVVVEAGKASGSLYTASAAREQGKPLFVVPGSIDSPSAVGTNALLAEGARAVVDYSDILRCLNAPDGAEDEEKITMETVLRIRQEGKREEKETVLAKMAVAEKGTSSPEEPEGRNRGEKEPLLSEAPSAEATSHPVPPEKGTSSPEEPEGRNRGEKEPFLSEVPAAEATSHPVPPEKGTSAPEEPEGRNRGEKELLLSEVPSSEPAAHPVPPEKGTSSPEEPEGRNRGEKEPLLSEFAAPEPDDVPVLPKKQRTVSAEEQERNRETLVRLFYGGGKQGKKKEAADRTEPVSRQAVGKGRKRKKDPALFNMNEKTSPEAPPEAKDDNFLKNMLTENALSVYHTISETPVYVDLLKEAVHLEIGDVLSALTELELMDLIRPLPGGKYVRKS